MRIAWTIAFGLIAALAVQAQDDHGPGRDGQPGFGRGRFRGPNAGFTALDLNADGTLDASEIQAASKSLAKLDKNLDGQITSDEVRMSMPPPPGRGRGGEQEGEARPNIAEETVKTLMAFDANGDGKLSKSELPERFQGIFNRGDENKDGFLTPEEIRKFASAQAAPPESAGPGGRGEGPRGEMNFIRMDPILAAVDADGDGILSAGEIRNAAASLRKLDKDGDGQITRDELMPARRPDREF